MIKLTISIKIETNDLFHMVYAKLKGYTRSTSEHSTSTLIVLVLITTKISKKMIRKLKRTEK